MLSAALEAGLTAAGREVWNLGLCPTPAVARLVQQQGAAGGVMVSASHNPPADNGIKLFAAGGSKLARQQQELIEAGLRGSCQLLLIVVAVAINAATYSLITANCYAKG